MPFLKSSRVLILTLTLTLPFSAQSRILEEALGIQDRIAQFVGNPDFYQSIELLDLQYGTRAKTKNQPWSGSYWPLYAGSVASPYAVPEFNGHEFNEVLALFRVRMSGLQANYTSLSPAIIENLSPSEKYDLYLGDRSFSLTNAIWDSVEAHALVNGKIEGWEGSCHGWSTASAYTPRPAHAISMLSLDGKTLIPFFPDDIKALDTLLWANSLIQDYTLIEGIRCQSNDPTLDPGTGRVMDTSCKGVNPGVWHLAVVGLVGAQKNSFIVNRQHNTEVWNQPVAGFEMTYSNPLTKKAGTLKESIVALSDLKDELHAFRAEGTAYLVSVQMNLSYVAEAGAGHAYQDTEENDSLASLDLEYDLELDADHHIIGGEWKWSKDAMPDYPGFMWKFQSAQPMAMSIVDSLTPDVQSEQFTSEKLVPLSQRAAQFKYKHFRTGADGVDEVAFREAKPQPIAKVVNYLLELSHVPGSATLVEPKATPGAAGAEVEAQTEVETEI